MRDVTTYGLEVPQSSYRPEPDFISEVETTASGNVVLRILRTRTELGASQVAYVVLTPGETRKLADVLARSVA